MNIKKGGIPPIVVLPLEKNLTEEKIAWIKLNLFPCIGPQRFRCLREYFGEISKVFQAKEKYLAAVENIGEKIASLLVSHRATIERLLEKELRLIEKYDVKVLILSEKDYPFALAAIPNPPPLIYLQGELKKEDQFSLAVVGTRYPSDYGCQAVKKLVKELVEYNFTVISGLARGIDTLAHRTTLDNKGRTIAVLGNGLLINYPGENKKLQEQIITQGALITEFPLQFPPDKGNFPRRNRIISGLSLGSLVIEGRQNSGALITARYALEQGREVFALPGNIFNPLSGGPHSLLKMGAKLVEKSEDILEELSIFYPQENKNIDKKEKFLSAPVANLSDQELSVYEAIPFDPVPIDLLSSKTNFSISQLLDNLMRLELKGLIKSLPGKMFSRNPQI